ncbi:MAG: SDR family NAD(P)-dependent oxidoreductase, partial [Acidobacteriota bacterium]|nr:SDR family NAD(P)-dependent oxidoreductase [Acidobacteriota bacterium]
MSGLDLTDRVAIVTGGAGGIGTCIAKSYAEAGARVVVASRKKENLDGVVGEIESGGGTALAVGCDITVPDQVDGLIAETVGAFGRLAIMVNNAGGGATPRMPEDT